MLFPLTFSSVSIEVSLRNDSLKRSFCHSVEHSDIIFDGSEEIIPRISKERSVALSPKSAQHYADLFFIIRKEAKTPLYQKGLIYPEADPSVETKYSVNPEDRCQPIYYDVEKDVFIELLSSSSSSELESRFPSMHNLFVSLSHDEQILFFREILMGFLLGFRNIVLCPAKNSQESYGVRGNKDLRDYSLVYLNILERTPFLFSLLGILQPYFDNNYNIFVSENKANICFYSDIGTSLNFLKDFVSINDNPKSLDRGEILSQTLPSDFEGLLTLRLLAYWYMSAG